MLKGQRRLVDQNGKPINENLDYWRSARYEVWSEPFGKWLRTEDLISLRPGQYALDSITHYAKDQGLKSDNVRMMIAF